MNLSLYEIRVNAYGVPRPRISFSPDLWPGETAARIQRFDFTTAQSAEIINDMLRLPKLTLAPGAVYRSLIGLDKPWGLTLDSITLLPSQSP